MKLFYSTLFVLLLCLALNSQSVRYNNIREINFGSDIFMPGDITNNGLKANCNLQWFKDDKHMNYNIAYNFIKNLHLKFSYRSSAFNDYEEKRYLGGYGYKVKDFEYTIGFHKFLKIYTLKDFERKSIKIRQKIKNYKRKLSGKEEIDFNKVDKKSGFLIEGNIGYTSSRIKVIDDLYFPAAIGRIASRDLGIAMDIASKKINADVCLYYISPTILEVSYCFRYSLVNYTGIYSSYLDNITDIHHQNIEFMKRDPFHLYESNIKVNFNFNKFETYLKVNDIFGKSNMKQDFSTVQLLDLEYSAMVYHTSIVGGIVLNINKLFDVNLKVPLRLKK